MLPIRPRLASVAVAALLLSGCASLSASPDGSAPSPTSSPSSSASSSASPSASEAAQDPDAPTGWGPTVGELEAAQELVSTWSAEQLAGGVIVGRFHGTDPQEPAEMVRRLHLAGVSVTTDNIVDG